MIMKARLAYLKGSLEHFLYQMNIALLRRIGYCENLRGWRGVIRAVRLEVGVDFRLHMGK